MPTKKRRCRICKQPGPRSWCDGCREIAAAITAALHADMIGSPERTIDEEREIRERIYAARTMPARSILKHRTRDR